MLRTSRVLLTLFALAPLVLSGCYVEAHSVPPPDDELVYEAEPPPPPPPQVEVIPVSPGPEFVWIGGYHRWNGRAYVWVGGRYERRPHHHARYVPAHWGMRGRVHVWVGGRWE